MRDFSTWVCFSPYLRETERLCSHGRNPDWQTPLSGCPWTHSLECQTASSGLPSNAEKNSKNKKASLLYILEGSYEGLQKVLWSSTYHIQKISVIRPENLVSCDISSCHGHFVLTVAALKGDKWRSCLSKKLLRILNLIKHTKNKEIELLTQYIGGL